MAYENKIAIESCIKKVHKEQGTIEKAESIINEIEEVYRKAKAFDELVEYKRNIMAVKEISLTHATEVPFNSDMYSVHSLVDNLLDVINDFEERADDER